MTALEDALEDLYRRYLASGLDPAVAGQLADVLERVGLTDVSLALSAYLRSGSGARFQLPTGLWAGHRCQAGPLLPTDAEPGDLWYDVVELTPMVLLPGPDPARVGSRRWVSLHPAYVWQFRTFRKLVDWRVASRYFLTVKDLLAPERFVVQGAFDDVANIYFEEALAYARWFGKFLARQFDLQAARDFLPPREFEALLPAGLRLWDEVEPVGSEFTRAAIGRDTLDLDADAESELRASGENVSLSDRMLFEEWDHEPNVGFSTMALAQTGLLTELPRPAGQFVELLSSAPRPPAAPPVT
ncbi:MAG: hypothetical protein ACRDIY_21805 [Chloroflexota bacterium]